MASQQLKVLLIDDNPADAALVERLLNRESDFVVDFEHCTEPEAGLAAITASMPDCLLLDYNLGKASGLELLISIRKMGSDVPIVVLTGTGSETVAVEAMRCGAQDYLVKDDMTRGSITSDALHRAITRAVETVALERRIADQQRELESFVSVASHDIKTPICVAKDNIELLRDFYADKPLDAGGKQMLRSALGALDRTVGMLDSLLEYSRVGRSNKALVFVDLNGCAEAVRANFETTIRRSGTSLVIGQMPTVLGDKDALTQLLQNLTANAIKFSAGDTPVVKLSAERSTEGWTIAVEDNGIGIDPQNAKEIFAPFKKLHSRGEFDGSGIGLATCKRIVDQHGGEIWVESAVGKGAKFLFTLTAADEAEAPSFSRQVPAEALHPAAVQ